MSLDYDVSIVGGGPAGLVAAKEIAKEGYRVCIIEEHQEIGYPVQCSGLFSVSGLNTLGLKLDDSIISNTIKGGRFFSPKGKELLAYSDVERAYVVERKLFDKYLAREAVRAGAEILLKTRMIGLKVDGNVSIKVEGLRRKAENSRHDAHLGFSSNQERKDTITSKLLIGADGTKSNVARLTGLPGQRKVVAAAQIEVEQADVAPDVAELYLGREYAPNFYGWILPKGDVFEVGVGVREPKLPLLTYLKRFINNHPVASKKIKSKSILELNMGGIPIGLKEDTVRDRVMIVGDAAGQVKATTGGGVITGCIASLIAGRACINALESNDFSKGFLKQEYEDRWKEELGFEFEVHRALRQMFDSMTDDQLEEFFEIAIEEDVSSLMVKYQDTDRPSEFVKELLKNERLLDMVQKFLYPDTDKYL